MSKVNRRTNEQWRRILAACEASGLALVVQASFELDPMCGARGKFACSPHS